MLDTCHNYLASFRIRRPAHSFSILCIVFAIDILKFDNSYSWARSKEVFYTVKLLPPGAKPHLHVPPGEMEKAESGEEGHTPNSSRSSTHSSEFYDCDVNNTELQVSQSDDTQVNVNDNDEQKGAYGTSS